MARYGTANRRCTCPSICSSACDPRPGRRRIDPQRRTPAGPQQDRSCRSSADIRFTADQSRPAHEAALDVSLSVPDFARCAEAAALPVAAAGRFAYTRALTLGPDSGAIDGRLTIGPHEILADLSIAAEARRPVIGGRVSAQALALGDVRRLAGVARSLATLRTRMAPHDAQGAPAPHRGADDVARHPMRHPRIDVEVGADRSASTAGSAAGRSRMRWSSSPSICRSAGS
jgi:hypothetical protein